MLFGRISLTFLSFSGVLSGIRVGDCQEVFKDKFEESLVNDLNDIYFN